jgi:ABC-type phosphate transport system substrate-binding protein
MLHRQHLVSRVLAVLLGSLALSSAALAQGVVVIANKSVPVEKIDAGQATQIFLKQVQTWPNGTPIQPIDIKEGAPLRAEFYAKVIGRSAGQLRAYWARQAFTGMGFPPREVATAEDVNKAVQATPGSVGYVDRRNSDGATKLLLDPGR